MKKPLATLMLVVLCGCGGARAVGADELEAAGLMGLAGCLQASRPANCIGARAVSFIEEWFFSAAGDGEEEEPAYEGGDATSPQNRQEPERDDGDRLPEGLPPFVHDLVESLVSRLSSIFGGGKDDEEERSGGHDGPDATTGHVVEARGKKKVRKAIKRAIIKLIIIALLIKHKLKMLLMAFQTFLQFKFLLLASLYVITAIFKLWAEIKHKHHPQKVIYYENAHHQHHYDRDHDHHYDDSWTGGLWGRSIAPVVDNGLQYQSRNSSKRRLTTMPIQHKFQNSTDDLQDFFASQRS